MKPGLESDLILLISLLWGLLATQLTLYFMTPGREAGEGETTPVHFGATRLRRIFFMITGALARLIRPLPLVQARKKTAARMLQAGLPEQPDQFFAACLLCGLLFALAGMLIDGLAGTAPSFLIIMAILGLVYPRIWLSGTIHRRRIRIFRDLPDMLDILRLAVTAGLDFSSALHVVVQAGTSGPLLQELEVAERDMILGQTRTAALESMAQRLGMGEVNSFVLAVKQAEELGAPIAPILQIQSETARQARWQAAETLIGKLPMKLLAPLVICIFPSSFLILFTPLVLDYMSSGF